MSPPLEALKGLSEIVAPAASDKDRDLLYELAQIVVINCGVQAEYGIGPIKYNVDHKIHEEIGKLAPETVAKVLSETKALLDKWDAERQKRKSSSK
jgi:hypothetical protein